jgi:hypothetical protein
VSDNVNPVAASMTHTRKRDKTIDFSITSYIGVADGAEDLDHPDDRSGLAPEARFVDLDQ